jgi:hypothetical protein
MSSVHSTQYHKRNQQTTTQAITLSSIINESNDNTQINKRIMTRSRTRALMSNTIINNKSLVNDKCSHEHNNPTISHRPINVSLNMNMVKLVENKLTENSIINHSKNTFIDQHQLLSLPVKRKRKSELEKLTQDIKHFPIITSKHHHIVNTTLSTTPSPISNHRGYDNNKNIVISQCQTPRCILNDSMIERKYDTPNYLLTDSMLERKYDTPSDRSLTDSMLEHKYDTPITNKRPKTHTKITNRITSTMPDVLHHKTKHCTFNNDYSKRQPIRLPKSNERVTWCKIDNWVHNKMDSYLKSNNHWYHPYITQEQVDEIIIHFDNLLYDSVLSCPIISKLNKPRDNNSQNKFRPKSHKILEDISTKRQHYRQLKRKLYKEWCDIHKHNTNTTEAMENKRKMRKCHNKLVSLRKRRLLIINQQQQKEQTRKFKRNPFEFSNTLLNGEQSNIQPPFSKEQCYEFFKNTYHDNDRSYVYKSPINDTSKSPPLPINEMSAYPPNLSEVLQSIKSKRNSAKPGFNGISNVIYKRITCIHKHIWHLFKLIFKCQHIPRTWSQAFIILLEKSDNISSPDQYRPIALTDSLGKIFNSIIGKRLELYMNNNNKYINTKIQKGFLSKIAGCTEHSYKLSALIQNSTWGSKSIVITWLDLKNAYGSIRHNMIQYALTYYHVPQVIRQLIYNYYEQLSARVITKDWSTEFFSYDIGLFQGCVMSTILFDITFNILLDMLSPLQHLGYHTRNVAHKNVFIDVTCAIMAYADDLTLITNNFHDNQLLLNVVDNYLNWSVTMKANPKKCKHLSIIKKKNITRAIVNNAPLYISGEQIKSIGTDKFKFLGKQIDYTGKESIIINDINNKLKTYMSKINKSHINGVMKAWIYQHVILSKLSWYFITYQLPLTIIHKLTTTADIYLRKWFGLNPRCNTTILYQTRDKCGLGLTTITMYFKTLQIARLLLMKRSSDTDIISIFNSQMNIKHSREWRATDTLKQMMQRVDFNTLFAQQSDRHGLGFIKHRYERTLSIRLLRDRVMSLVKSEELNILMNHCNKLKLNGIWSTFHLYGSRHTFNWKSLIQLHPKLIKFALNGALCFLPVNSNLRQWCHKRDISTKCKLFGCGKETTVTHALAGCKFALRRDQNRYLWRHDSILTHIFKQIQHKVDLIKSEPNVELDQFKPIKFIRSNMIYVNGNLVEKNDLDQHELFPPEQLKHINPVIGQKRLPLLKLANDWTICLDSITRSFFPPHITISQLRPDGLIYSNTQKICLILELTCPYDDNIKPNHDTKMDKYKLLVNECQENGWRTKLLCFEVGACGTIAHSTIHMLQSLGFSRKETKTICKELEIMVMKCSFAIYINHKSETGWNRDQPLLLGPRTNINDKKN